MDETEFNFECGSCGAKAKLPQMFLGCYRPCPQCGRKGLVGAGTPGTPASGPATPASAAPGPAEPAPQSAPPPQRARVIPHKINHAGIVSLWLIVGGWALSIGLGLVVNSLAGESPLAKLVSSAIQAVLAIVAGLMILAGFVLCIVSLAQHAAQPGAYMRGKSHAWGALGLSICSFCIIAIGFAFAGDRLKAAWNRNPVQSVAAPPTSATAAPAAWVVADRAPAPEKLKPDVEMADLNFRFSVPSKAWSSENPREIMSGAIAGFSRKKPDIFFSIAVNTGEMTEEITTERFARKDLDEFMAASGPFNVLKQEGYEVNGCRGIATVIETESGSAPLYFAFWTFVNKGFMYKMVTVAAGNRVKREAFETESMAVFMGFRLIDPDYAPGGKSGG